MLLYSTHNDPQLKGTAALLIGNFIHAVLTAARGDYSRWLSSHGKPSKGTVFTCPKKKAFQNSCFEVCNVFRDVVLDKSVSCLCSGAGRSAGEVGHSDGGRIISRSSFEPHRPQIVHRGHSEQLPQHDWGEGASQITGLSLDWLWHRRTEFCGDFLVILQLLLSVLRIRNNTYWLVKVELCELLSNIDFKLVSFLEDRSSQLRRGQHHYIGVRRCPFHNCTRW